MKATGMPASWASYVTVEDVKAVAYKVLRHRLILTYEAEAEEMKSDEVIKDLLNQIEVA